MMNEVINEHHIGRAASFGAQTPIGNECYVQKRKSRRVRTQAKPSNEKFVNNKYPEDINNSTRVRRNSTNSLFDKRPFPFGQCRVCMDKATGAHYGVPTCEGCKGFFKRSILRKEKYRCYFGDGCVINTDNRNRCKSCRFQKCLKEGMSVEGVRMGRIPKLVKEKALAEHHLSSSSIENDDPSSSTASSSPPCMSLINNSSSNNLTSTDVNLPFIDEQFFLDDFDSISIDSPSTALSSCNSYLLHETLSIDEKKYNHRENLSVINRPVLRNCTVNYDEQYSTNVIERIRTFVSTMVHPLTNTESNNEQLSFIRYLQRRMFDLCNTYNGCTKQFIERMNSMITLEIKEFPGDRSSLQDIWAGLTEAIPFHVKNLITFAREMPAINEIDLDDFQKIMNNRLFDFWLIKHAPLIRNSESYIMLPNGLQYTREWMNKIMGEEMVETMFEFAKQFNALNLTQGEYALVFPIVICVKDKTLNDQETVHHIQCCYLYALYTQMLTTRSQTESKTVFRNLLQIFAFLPLLNELQEKQAGSIAPDNMESES